MYLPSRIPAPAPALSQAQIPANAAGGVATLYGQTKRGAGGGAAGAIPENQEKVFITPEKAQELGLGSYWANTWQTPAAIQEALKPPSSRTPTPTETGFTDSAMRTTVGAAIANMAGRLKIQTKPGENSDSKIYELLAQGDPEALDAMKANDPMYQAARAGFLKQYEGDPNYEAVAAKWPPTLAGALGAKVAEPALEEGSSWWPFELLSKPTELVVGALKGAMGGGEPEAEGVVAPTAPPAAPAPTPTPPAPTPASGGASPPPPMLNGAPAPERIVDNGVVKRLTYRNGVWGYAPE